MICHELTKEEACQILYRFQLRPNRPGFFYTVQAILMMSRLSDQDNLLERDLYQKLAAVYHVSEESVKHDISATLHSAWRHDPDLLSQLAGQQLSRIPSVSVFLRILASARALS